MSGKTKAKKLQRLLQSLEVLDLVLLSLFVLKIALRPAVWHLRPIHALPYIAILQALAILTLIRHPFHYLAASLAIASLAIIPTLYPPRPQFKAHWVGVN